MWTEIIFWYWFAKNQRSISKKQWGQHVNMDKVTNNNLLKSPLRTEKLFYLDPKVCFSLNLTVENPANRIIKVCPCISCMCFMYWWHNRKVKRSKSCACRVKWEEKAMQQQLIVVCPSEVDEPGGTGGAGRRGLTQLVLSGSSCSFCLWFYGQVGGAARRKGWDTIDNLILNTIQI